MNNISFPALGIDFNINPVAFTLPVIGEVRWYGIIIGLGILLAFLYCSYIAKKEDVSPDVVADLLIYALPISVICARTYYVAFSWDSYKDNLSDVFKIWEGGIAIYGAIIGAVITGLVFCKIKKIKTLKLFDICCQGLMIGQLIGRWGNFANAEAFGGYASNFLVMSINGNAPVHPNFLYESLWTLAGFFLHWNYEKRKRFHGEVFLMYVLWYGVGRAWIEGLRTDSLMLGTIRISQLVAILTAVVAVILILKNRKKYKDVPVIYPELEEETHEKSDD